MLANVCWQIQIGVCERHNNMFIIKWWIYEIHIFELRNEEINVYYWQTVGEKLARIETSFIFRQQFANTLLCRSHTPIWVCQHEIAKISLTCEGRLRVLNFTHSKVLSCLHTFQFHTNVRKRLRELLAMGTLGTRIACVSVTSCMEWRVVRERLGVKQPLENGTDTTRAWKPIGKTFRMKTNRRFDQLDATFGNLNHM